MKSSRSTHVTAKPPPPANLVQPEGGLIRSWVRFWFAPVDPFGLHVVRCLSGLLFLAWLLPFAGHLDSLFGLQGWFDQQAYAEAARLTESPLKPTSWSVLYLCGSDPGLLRAAYWLSVAVVVCFTLGVWPRATAVLTWVVVGSFTVNPVLDYDADVLFAILSFYLMIGYLLLGLMRPGQSAASVLLGPMLVWPLRRSTNSPASGPPVSAAANLALRLLQVHFAVVIVASGLHKLQGGEWWAGGALWFSLYPPIETKLAAILALAPQRDFLMTTLSVATYAVLAWQIGFPLYAWRPRWWRLVLLGGAVLGWLATAFLIRMPLLGPAYLIGCLGFVSASEWQRVSAWLTRLPGLSGLANFLPARTEGEDDAASKRQEAASLVTVGQR